MRTCSTTDVSARTATTQASSRRSGPSKRRTGTLSFPLEARVTVPMPTAGVAAPVFLRLAGEGAGVERTHAMVLIGSRCGSKQNKHGPFRTHGRRCPCCRCRTLSWDDAWRATWCSCAAMSPRLRRQRWPLSGAVSTVAAPHHECVLDGGGEEAEEMVEDDGPDDS